MRLFKFVPPERLDILENQRVAFTPPGRFKDPYELKPNFDKSVGKLIFEQAFAEYKDSAIPPHLSPRQRRKWARSLKASEKKNWEFQNLAKATEQSVARHLDKTLGLLCLTSDLLNNLLWYHYADGHRGFAIELDSEDVGFKKLGQLHQVEYLTSPLKFHSRDMPSKELARSKPDYLKYESEYRIVRHLRDCRAETISSTGETIYFVELAKELIKSIYLGHRVENRIQSRIKTALAGTATNIQRVIPTDGSYKLTTTSL